MRLSLVLLSAVSLITLAACAPVGRGVEQIADAAHNESVEFDHRVRDWFDTENEGRVEPQPKPAQTAYCYQTLGESECYTTPQRGEESRLAGVQLPKPTFEQYDYPTPELVKPPVPVVVIANQEPAAGSTVIKDGDVTYVVPPGAVESADVPEYRMPRELPAPF